MFMVYISFSAALVFACVHHVKGLQAVRYNDSEHRLVREIFRNYSSEVRPVLEPSFPVVVQFDLAFSQLVQLNAKSQILTSKIWIRQRWTNPFLIWNSSDYGGISFINISPKLVWKPDIVLYNSIQGDSGEMYNFHTKVVLSSDGSIQWFAPTEVKTICKIDISFFPFDTQTCTMLFGSWTYTGPYLNLTLKRDTADLSGYTMSGEWDLLAARAKRNVVKYSCCPDPYIDITYTFTIRRKVLFYINNLIFPIIALAILGMFGYFLPPESGERISLLITIMLGLSVYTLIFTENIPATSEVTPLLSRYSTAIMVELGISLILSCLVIGIYHGDCTKAMPKWMEFLILGLFAKLLRVKYPENQATENSNNQHLQNLNGRINTEHEPVSSLYFPRNTTDQGGVDDRLSPNDENGSACLTRKLDEMISKLDRFLDKSSESKIDDDCAKQKWHFAARVTDRVIFWIYTMTVVFSTIALYLLIPSDAS